MRYDYNRTKFKTEAQLWVKNKLYKIKINEISNFGCNFSGAVDIKLGSIVDIVVSTNIFFTGLIINKNQFSYGVSILSVSKNVLANISNICNGNNVIHENRSYFSEQTKNILVIGAGAGKILAQLEILQIIESEKKQSLYSLFDSFVGVSSGGILSALIAMEYSLDDIHEMLEKNNHSWSTFHLNYFNSLLNNDYLKKRITNIFQDRTFLSLKRELMVVSRGFSNGIYIYSTNYSDPNIKIKHALLESISIPILFGVEKDMVDGAVGMFINPSEVILRHYRSLGQNMSKVKIFYLDAGFDPIQRYKNEKKNIVNQLFWLLEITFKDLIITSLEKIDYHFPEVEFHPYIFSYYKP